MQAYCLYRARRRAQRVLAVLLLVVAATLAAASPLRAEPQAPIDQFILAKMAAAKVPGLAACIIRESRIDWSRGYGWANIEEQVPVTPDTIFMLASVSKTVTGTALMQVYDEGLFGLDDDVNDHLDFPVVNPGHPGVPITFRQLLAHTSSIRDNWGVLSLFYTDGDSPIPLGLYVAHYLAPGGLLYFPRLNYHGYAPGTGGDYSNAGFALNGHLVEAITGTPFDQYCNENIFAPLGMDETSWFLRDLDESRVAMPYTYRYLQGEHAPTGHYGYPDYPDGQLRTSVAQLARFLIAHIDFGLYQGTRILDPATAAAMRTVQFPGIDPIQGLAFYYWVEGGEIRLGHNGGDEGVRTEMWMRPADGAGVILMANGSTLLPWEDSALVDIVDKLFEVAGAD